MSGAGQGRPLCCASGSTLSSARLPPGSTQLLAFAAAAGSAPSADGASVTTRCTGSTLLVLHPQQASSQDVAWEMCRQQHGPSAYLPSQGAVLEAAQALVQGAQVGSDAAASAVVGTTDRPHACMICCDLC